MLVTSLPWGLPNLYNAPTPCIDMCGLPPMSYTHRHTHCLSHPHRYLFLRKQKCLLVTFLFPCLPQTQFGHLFVLIPDSALYDSHLVWSEGSGTNTVKLLTLPNHPHLWLYRVVFCTVSLSHLLLWRSKKLRETNCFRVYLWLCVLWENDSWMGFSLFNCRIHINHPQ